MFFGRGKVFGLQNDTISVKSCINIPANVNSAGLEMQLEGVVKGYRWLDFTLPRVMLLIATIFIISNAFHSVLRRFGIPSFISQIFTGILLSRPALQYIGIAAYVHTRDNAQLFGSIGNLGFALYIFQSGVKMDINMVARVGRKAWYVGILSVIGPIVACLLATKAYGLANTGIFLAPIYYSTSFPVVFGLLTDLKILNSEIGRLAQSSAIIAEFVSYGTVMVVTLIEIYTFSTRELFLSCGSILIYTFLIIVIVRPIMLMVVRSTPEGGQVTQTGLYLVITIFLLFLRFTPEFFSEFKVVGLYILGLAVPLGPPLGSALVNKFDCLVSGLFLPIFVTTAAMRLYDFRPSSFSFLIWFNLLTALVAVLGKFVVVFFALRYWKMHRHDAISLALIMNAKGVVEMGYYTLAYDENYISPNMHRFMFMIVILVGSIVPMIVRNLYNPSRKYTGYQIKKLIDCNPHSQLQVVCCIHVPNNISSAISLLNISCPTRESPIAANALHLIKLNGQAVSIFISHQKKKESNNVSAYSYSENVILSFKKFEGLHWDSVSINTFTAISPTELMHDDICTLALDKLASLVILPFHRTWYNDGSPESEDQTVRILNQRILEKAPCSVGILVDRGNLRSPIKQLDSSSDSLCNVAMLFLGGNDDREALTYAKRMARGGKVRLTVEHFIAESDDGDVDWETILDSEVLRDVTNSDKTSYVKHFVNDGVETVEIVHSLVNEYDLFILGRRYNLESQQTACLKEWSEFPELGILGDLLASKDVDGKCSVLVMQQQHLV